MKVQIVDRSFHRQIARFTASLGSAGTCVSGYSLLSDRTPEGGHIIVEIAPDEAATVVEGFAPDVVRALRDLTEWGCENTSPRDTNSPHALLVAAHAALGRLDGGRKHATTTERGAQTAYGTEAALSEIREELDGVEWTPETLNRICAILVRSGYPIHDLDGSTIEAPQS
jgi:hypothetical protein